MGLLFIKFIKIQLRVWEYRRANQDEEVEVLKTDVSDLGLGWTNCSPKIASKVKLIYYYHSCCCYTAIVIII